MIQKDYVKSSLQSKLRAYIHDNAPKKCVSLKQISFSLLTYMRVASYSV